MQYTQSCSTLSNKECLELNCTKYMKSRTRVVKIGQNVWYLNQYFYTPVYNTMSAHVLYVCICDHEQKPISYFPVLEVIMEDDWYDIWYPGRAIITFLRYQISSAYCVRWQTSKSPNIIVCLTSNHKSQVRNYLSSKDKQDIGINNNKHVYW